MISVFWQMLEHFFRHPSDRLLIALHGNNIPDRLRIRTLAHLRHCPHCRLRVEQIQRDWDFLAELNLKDGTGQVQTEKIASGLQDSIRAWSANHLQDFSNTAPLDRAEAERRMQAVLGVYLGKRAAAALLRPSGESEISAQDTVANAGSTLRILLGSKSAKAIEAKLLRILGRVQESTRRSSLS